MKLHKNTLYHGTRPSPSLSISRRFVSPPEGIPEATCTPLVSPVSFSQGSTGSGRHPAAVTTFGELTGFQKPTLLFPLNLTCTCHPDESLSIRSEYNNHQLVFAVGISTVRGRKYEQMVWGS